MLTAMYMQACSNFVAGDHDALRSSQRYHALDKTAVFDTACRHEFPHALYQPETWTKVPYVYKTLIVCYNSRSEVSVTMPRIT